MKRTCSRKGFERGKFTVFVAGIFCLTLAVGCGEKEEGEVATTTKKSETAAPVVDVATAATVTGRVLFSGTPPKMQLVDRSSEGTCHDEASPLYTENVLVNDNGTLRNVFVYVKDGLGDMTFPPPSEPVVLDQVGCSYKPHIFGIQAKQPLKIKNSDGGVLHNIHTISKRGNGFNFGMPKVMETTKKFKRPETMVRIKCDVHGWMGAYVGVVSHPYYSVTGEDGTFELSPLPPGEYVIETWHEEYGTQTQTVTVTEKETKEITFTFKPAS
ncbi:MAG: carboxypeptidase regulatory-like domain-containing protein [Candidatus Krumholzibacteria bacterium]